MTISYPLAFPTVTGITTLGMSPRAVVASLPSPFTLEEEVQVWDGARWEIEIQVSPVVGREDAGPWMGFLAALNGREGKFLFGDPLAALPLGSAGGTPVVNTVGSPTLNTRRSRTLYTRGWPGMAANVLKTGDFFQLYSGASRRLHMNVTDASSDSSGDAVLDVWPPLREDVPDGTAITVNAPQGVFRMSTNSPRWNISGSIEHGFAIPATEVI